MLKALVLVVAAAVLAGCGQVLAREDGAMRVAFIAPTSRSAADDERTALRIAFAEANRRRAFGLRRIVLEDGFHQDAVAVFAGKESPDEDWAQQIAFLAVARRGTSQTLQPMQPIYCATPYRSCSTNVAARQAAFARSFRQVSGKLPGPEAYVAYAEGQSLSTAIQRLLAEDELSAENLRRALAFGEFSTVLGDLRYAMPPDMTDQILPHTEAYYPM